MNTIRFLKHKVVNDTTKQSARVFYSLDNRTDGRKCVTLYAKSYSDKLTSVFDSDEVINETDTMTDYFCKDRVVLFEGNPLYKDAQKRANENNGVIEDEPTLFTPKSVSKDDLEVADVYMNLLTRLGVKNIIA